MSVSVRVNIVNQSRASVVATMYQFDNETVISKSILEPARQFGDETELTRGYDSQGSLLPDHISLTFPSEECVLGLEIQIFELADVASIIAAVDKKDVSNNVVANPMVDARSTFTQKPNESIPPSAFVTVWSERYVPEQDGSIYI